MQLADRMLQQSMVVEPGSRLMQQLLQDAVRMVGEAVVVWSLDCALQIARCRQAISQSRQITMGRYMGGR